MTEGQILFMTDHYRAAADMVMKWAMSESSTAISNWLSGFRQQTKSNDCLISWILGSQSFNK